MTQQTVRHLAGFWSAAGPAIVNTLMPPRCRACGCSIARWESGTVSGQIGMDEEPAVVLGRYLCTACADSYTAIQSPRCTRCGKMFRGRQGPDHLCEDCTRHPWQFARARSVAVFDRSLAALIHQFKYSGRTGLAQPLGRLMLAVLRENWQPQEIDRIVPIPLHPERLRSRGFNQSALLARTWANGGNGTDSAWSDIPIAFDVISRTRPTASQTGLGRQARVANLKGAFRVSPGKAVAGLRLLLVDDVFTTGATANACARVLMDAGARRVDLLTLARTHTGYGTCDYG